MSERDPKKFDPARADVLDAPEREAYLPTAELIDLLDLEGVERVVDYGAGTGRLSLAVAGELAEGARVVAVEESNEMFERLSARVAAVAGVEAILIGDNRVPLDDGWAQRILALNVLHEVRGETALTEMRRLLGVFGAEGAVREPQPGLEQLDRLVERARQAGLPVSV
ncbi:MAG TPA: class I SAM-dependent methyltransferase, partial [Solirubrobacteraceae bacterium]|nr:class I SAM-dependent methyltransferase [Solirubrobacteraceae bacterium]